MPARAACSWTSVAQLHQHSIREPRHCRLPPPTYHARTAFPHLPGRGASTRLPAPVPLGGAAFWNERQREQTADARVTDCRRWTFLMIVIYFILNIILLRCSIFRHQSPLPYHPLNIACRWRSPDLLSRAPPTATTYRRAMPITSIARALPCAPADAASLAPPARRRAATATYACLHIPRAPKNTVTAHLFGDTLRT